MSEKKTKKVDVRDLKPSTDAKGGRHSHHHGHHQRSGKGGGSGGRENSADSGPPYL